MAYLTNTVKNETGKEISISDSYKLKDYELEGDTYQGKLPSEYQAVEYIQSTGREYINTGYILKGTDIIDIIYDNIADGFVFGSRASSSASYSGITNESTGQYNIRMGNNVIYNKTSRLEGTVKVHIENRNIAINDEIVSTTAYGSSFFNGNCYLFTTNQNGSPFTGEYAINRIRYFKIKGIIELIPCYRINDNVIGMYDLINNVFYTNAGTGAFTKGSNSTMPNPDYPREIQIVTGRQEIKIDGKNLLNVDMTFPQSASGLTFTRDDDGKININGTVTANASVFLTTEQDITLEAGTYTLSRGETIRSVYLIPGYRTGTFTLTEKTTFNRVYIAIQDITGQTINDSFYPMLVKGTTLGNYEPYKGKKYEINLGKNLISLPLNSHTANGLTASWEKNTITVTGTNTKTDAAWSIMSNGNFTFPNFKAGETYTISCPNKPSVLYIQINYFRSNSTQAYLGGTGTSESATFTVPADYDRVAQIFLGVQPSAGTLNTTFNIQLERGSKATSYAPYFEPIWLGKINTYKDMFIRKKSTNNVLNITSDIFYPHPAGGGYATYKLNDDKTIEYVSGSGGWAWNYSNCQIKTTLQAGTYTLSVYPSNIEKKIYKSDGTELTTTFTLSEDTQIGIACKPGTSIGNCYIMLNKGTTVLEYEPYEINEWYIYKQVQKLSLNGTESWGIATRLNSDTKYFTRTLTTRTNITTSSSTSGEICNYLKQNNPYTYIGNAFWVFDNAGSTQVRLGFEDTSITTIDDVKNWIQTHKLEIYYPLLLPTYTKITNQELINQLEAVRLLEGTNEITVDSVNLPATLNMNYYSTNNPYQNAIYSQDDRNDLKIYFNDVELEDARRYCEKITRTARILPNDGGKRFSLDNFISTSVEVILHNVDLEDIADQVRIEIGTDIGNNTYQYIPLGIFNIQDTPVKDGNKITLKLRDNRVKFDFNYNAYPLMQELGGTATKRQILEDICTKAGVENVIEHFDNEDDVLGIYDDTITATTYVSYLMEQAGLIATIDRYGRLTAVDLSKLDKWKIPYSIVESEEKGEPYSIERVVYEGGTIKYQTSEDETLDTLYLNSANPYISSDTQVENILSKLENFEIDSVKTKRVLGNPAIDPYDIIEVYNDLDGTNDVVFKTLANTTYTFNGVHRDTFDTQIGKEQRKENVSKNSPQSFQKYARAEIDNINATITQTVAEVTELQESIELFSVDLSQYNLIIATDNGQKPYTTETLSINYYGYYKGQQVTPTVSITGSETGVTTSTTSTAINFAVTNTTAIQNKSYTYTATFTYSADNATYTIVKKIIVALSQQGQQGQQGQTGAAGTSAYFYVRYSKNSDGNPMTTSPQSDTEYMGVASTTSPTAPTSYTAYTWSKTKGETGQQGIPGQAGEDGTSSYLHIKWSNDGETFTPAEGSTPAGKTPGRWQGTYVDTNPTDSSTFSDYNWVDTGIYVQDELNTLQTNIDNVDSRVTDTNTNLNNNYYNKDQVDAKSDANANSIATVTQRVVQLEQTNSQFSINVQRVIDQYGASKVTTATGYVFDENGMNISKTGSEMSNLLDNTGMFVRRDSTEMLGADATGVRSENLWVRKYLQMGSNSRFEDYESNRTACFYIGGSN